MANHHLKTIPLSDGRAWDGLCPGEFVVFLSDTRTDVLLDCGGKTADLLTAIPVFPSLADAKDYAEQTVARMPLVRAAIYDHHGRSGDPLLRVYHESIRKSFDPERSARRSAWTGACLLSAFAIWSVIAAHKSSEHFLWFYIVGVKLLVLGTVLFVRGVGFFLGRRSNRI